MTIWQYYANKVIGLVGSRKFWVMLFAALVAFGLDVSPEMQAFVILVATSIFSLGTAWEDAAELRGGAMKGAADVEEVASE